MSPAGGGEPPGRARKAALGASLGLAIVLIAALFLWSPVARNLVVPPGADTSAHLWRAEFTAASDLRSLLDAAPFDFQVNPDRVGLPVLASVLSAVGISPWRLMYVTAALAACLLAVAGWAFARAAGEPRWASPIYALVVAVSVPFVLTARSRLDNALAEGLLVAAAAALVWMAGGHHTGRVASILLAGGLLMHWAAGGVFLAVGGLFALLLLPGSIRQRREDGGWWATPSARISAALAAGLLLGAGPLLLTPGGNLPDRGTGRHFRGNVTRLLPRYRLPATAAAAGAAAGIVRSLRDRGPVRPATVLLGVWLVPAAAAGLLYVAGVGLPLMRFLGATMALPLFAALLLSSLLLWATRLRGRLRAPAVAVGGALVAGLLAISALGTAELLDASAPSITEEELPILRAAVTYAERVEASEVVIVVTHHPGRAFRRVRMLASPELIPHVGVFQGSPGALFARASAPPEPLPAGLEGVDLKNAAISADGVARMRRDGSIALSLEPFMLRYRRLLADPGNREVADGVLVLPRPGADPVIDGDQVGRLPPLAPPGAGVLVRDVAIAFTILVLAGLGWSLALMPAPWDVRAAMAPCLGLAGILIVGTLAGLSGIPLGGGVGVAALVLIAASGAVAAFVVRRRDREDASAAPTG